MTKQFSSSDAAMQPSSSLRAFDVALRHGDGEGGLREDRHAS